MKINLNFYFRTIKGFMKVLKVFIKPFEVPRRSIIKIDKNNKMNKNKLKQKFKSVFIFIQLCEIHVADVI